MRYKDNIEWLKSLKQQIGQTQHRDLWHFEQVIDETIDNLKPLATPHGRLIDADKLQTSIHGCLCETCETFSCEKGRGCLIEDVFNLLDQTPTVIGAEVSE